MIVSKKNRITQRSHMSGGMRKEPMRPYHKIIVTEYRTMLCLLLCICLCFSAELQFAGAQGKVAENSGSNAEMSSRIDGKSDSEQPGSRSYPFCSDHNLYLKNGKKIEQRDWEGNLLSSYEIEHLRNLWWVDNGWIYYSVKSSWKTKEELWRVPFSSFEGTDQILWDGKEMLLKYGRINAVCIWSHYLVYNGDSTGDDYSIGDSTYRRYDLQQKTSVALSYKGKKKFTFTEFISTLQNVPLVKDGFAFIGDPHYEKYFYCLDIENWKLQRISERKLSGDNLVATDNGFFYVSNKDIWKYDPVTNQSVLFADKKALNKIIQDIDPSSLHKKVYAGIYTMYGDRDKVYIQMYTSWIKKKGKTKAGSVIKQDHQRMVILSLQQDTPSKLCYEKGLSECLKEKSKHQYLPQWDFFAESGEVFTIVDGKCNLILYGDRKKNKKKPEWKDGYYSLETGEFRYITKSDREYYYPDYIGANQEHECAMGYE